MCVWRGVHMQPDYLLDWGYFMRAYFHLQLYGPWQLNSGHQAPRKVFLSTESDHYLLLIVLTFLFNY